ncbi:MerR family transcriptional regulator [Clostridium rectalis]|uniref:MerR family transcriptional regulator n=1 Tax=Clostridium rectalis TaxID=2040295 RepID=UPI000F6320AF|nr:MerR family transcriptional regulator [Clostridium rectalis]
MKISEVMKITKLTKKAINYYEEKGLIKPLVNEFNNYRHYTKEDVLKLKQIASLRSFGLSVLEISHALKDTKNLYKILSDYREKIQKQIKDLERCSSVIGSCVEDLKGQHEDIFKVTERMVTLKEAIEMNEKQRENFMERTLERIFPGPYGKLLSLIFGEYLREPLNTMEKEEAWINLVKALDTSDNISVTEEIIPYMQLEEEKWENLKNGVQSGMDRIFTDFYDDNFYDFENLNIDMSKEEQENLKIFFNYFKKEENIKLLVNTLEKIHSQLIILSSKYRMLNDKLVKREKAGEEKFKEYENKLKEEFIDTHYKIVKKDEIKLVGINYTEFVKIEDVFKLVGEFKKQIYKIKNPVNSDLIYKINGMDTLDKSFNNGEVFSTFIGIEVSNIENIPEHMVKAIIPSGEYCITNYKGNIESFSKFIDYMYLIFVSEKDIDIAIGPQISIIKEVTDKEKVKIDFYIEIEKL